MSAVDLENLPPTRELVTVGGWYELADGRVARIDWVQNGSCRVRKTFAVVDSWAEVGPYEIACQKEFDEYLSGG